jgi:hypothetical protein
MIRMKNLMISKSINLTDSLFIKMVLIDECYFT